MIPRRLVRVHFPRPVSRRPGSRWVRGAILAGAVWLLAGLADAAHVADRIVAIVNKEVIMLSELQTEMEPDRKRLAEQYRGAALKERLQQAEYRALNRMIERRLQMQIAKTKGIDVSDEDIRRTAQDMQRQGTPVDIDDPSIKKALKEQMILFTLENREVRSVVMISEADLQRFYETHLTLFMLPEEYRISQILITPKRSESRAEARKRAKMVYEELKKGGNFDELALRYSDGEEATRGGNLGFVRQGELDPPIERAVATLQPGQVCEPVETPQALHIIRLDEKKTAQFRPFPEVKNEMQSLVFQQKSADRYQLWMADLKRKAYIEIKL